MHIAYPADAAHDAALPAPPMNNAERSCGEGAAVHRIGGKALRAEIRSSLCGGASTVRGAWNAVVAVATMNKQDPSMCEAKGDVYIHVCMNVSLSGGRLACFLMITLYATTVQIGKLVNW